MLNFIILLALAILPVFLIGLFIYKKDKNKEPKSLLIKLFFSGLLAIIITLVIGIPLRIIIPIDMENATMFEKLFYSFFEVALVEELSKLLMVYLFAYKNKEYDHAYDIIVYSVFVSLGFAGFENLLYVLPGGYGTAILRALTSIPGHVCFAVFMGYYLSLAKNNKSFKYKFLSIFVPFLLHGFFDFCLYSQNGYFLLTWLVFIILCDIIVIKKINKQSKLPKNRKNLFCTSCGTKFEGKYCHICGKKKDV